MPGAGDLAFIGNSTGPVQISQEPVTVEDLTVLSGLAIGRQLTITGLGSIKNLNITGGHLAGAGAIDINGESEFLHGGIEAATDVSNSGIFTLPGGVGGQRTIGNSRFTNGATINQSDGLLLFNSQLVNDGDYNLLNATVSTTGLSRIENSGSIVGSATSALDLLVQNSGVLAVKSAGSSLTLSRGSAHTGGSIALEMGGTVNLTGSEEHTISALSASGIGDFVLNSNAIRITGELQAALDGTKGLWMLGGATFGPGKIINTGRAVLDGTTIGNTEGLVNNAPGGGRSLFFGPMFNHGVSSVLTNNGQIVHQSRQMTIIGTGRIINEAAGNYEFSGSDGSTVVGTGTFLNRGMIVKKDATSASLNSVLDLAGGTIDVQGGSLSLGGSGGGSTTGTFRVGQGGSLAFANEYTFTGNYLFEGDGAATIASTVTFNDGEAIFNMPGDGVSFATNNTIFIHGGTIENRGKFNWNSNGVISTLLGGRFVNAAGGTVALAGAQPFLSGTMENHGTVNHANIATLRIGGNSAFTNRGNYNVTNGLITMRNTGTHDFTNGAGATFKQSGDTTFTVDAPFNNLGGTVQIEAGTAVLNLDQGGTHSSGALFSTGANSQLVLRQNHVATGIVIFEGNGTAILRGTYTANTGTTGLDQFSPGAFRIIDVTATLTAIPGASIDIGGRFIWGAGRLQGGVIGADGIVSGGVTNRSSDFTIASTTASGSVLAGVLQNNGAIYHEKGAIAMNGGTLINTGGYFFLNDVQGHEIKSLAGGGHFINFGLLSAANSATISVPFDNRSGDVTVEQGTGNLTFTAGGNSVGAGTYTVNGPITFAGGVHSFSGFYDARGDSVFAVTAGEIRGTFQANLTEPGKFLVSGGTVHAAAGELILNKGRAEFAGSTISGEGGLANEGNLLIAAGVTKATRITNSSIVTIDGNLDLSGTYRNDSGARTTLKGAISGTNGFVDNQGAFIVFAAGPTNISHRFNNGDRVEVVGGHLTLSGLVDQYDRTSGTLDLGQWSIQDTLTLGDGEPLRRVTLGTEVFIGINGTFTNLPGGTITGNFTNEGRLVFDDWRSRTYTGQFINSGDLLLGLNGLLSANEFTSNGYLSGSGKIQGKSIVNGQLVSGNSPGVFTFEGSLLLTETASLEIEIEGSVVNDHDLVNVVGPATLGGNLDLQLPLGNDIGLRFEDELTILSATTLTGRFSNLPADGWLTSSDGLGRFHVAIGSQAVILSQFTPVPEPSSLLLMMGAMPLLRFRRARRVKTINNDCRRRSSRGRAVSHEEDHQNCRFT